VRRSGHATVWILFGVFLDAVKDSHEGTPIRSVRRNTIAVLNHLEGYSQVNSLFKRIELVANLAIIVVAIFFAVVLIRSYVIPKPSATQADTTFGIRTGTKLIVPDVDWSASRQTLVLALSTTCRFCSDSAPFYQRLAQEREKNPNLRLVALFPQATSVSRSYLQELGVNVDDVKQSTFESFGVNGTPTLILVNNQGIVEESWRGRLIPEKEAEVFGRLNTGTGAF
jgi:hypothetical protein